MRGKQYVRKGVLYIGRKKRQYQSRKYINTRQDQKDRKKYRRLKSGKGLANTIANLGLTMGSKTITLVLRKKTNRQMN